MAREATGQVLELKRKRGTVFALRFRAHGERQYLTLGSKERGWSRKKAEDELANVLADVRRGIWQPELPAAEAPVAPATLSFHEFATEWVESRRLEFRARTIENDEWALCVHLLPFFANYELSDITPELVDRYRVAKVRERELGSAASGNAVEPSALSNNSINKTIRKLAQVLDAALEYGHIERNPARGKRRLAKSDGQYRTWLDHAEPIEALLNAAGHLDENSSHRDARLRRPLLAALVFAGPRIGEALALRWRDVDLATGRLHIGRSKTDAGVRDVDLLPALREELASLKARARRTEADDLVFATSTGRPQSTSNVRSRVLRPSAALADEMLRAADRSPLPNITHHALRRTFASVLYAIGRSPVDVMDQMGHTDPALALRIYAKSMRRDAEALRRLHELVGVEMGAAVGAPVRVAGFM